VASGAVLERFNVPLGHCLLTELTLFLGGFGFPIQIGNLVEGAQLRLWVAMAIQAERHA
jgi:hypothetical protein